MREDEMKIDRSIISPIVGEICKTDDRHHNDVDVDVNSVINIFPNPMNTQMKSLRCLGRGGYGSVQLVRSHLDDRLIALKKIPFRSKLPPWEVFDIDDLDKNDREMYTKLLRELKALSACQNCPQVIKYYSSWIEPDYQELRRGSGSKSGSDVRVLRQLENENHDGNMIGDSNTSDVSHHSSSSSSNDTYSESYPRTRSERLWPYILNVSMEPIMGMTLYDWIRVKNAKIGKPGFGVIENIIFTQIVMGLKHIHGSGVLHRDIKPSNIMITVAEHDRDVKEISVKILDFGLAYIGENDKDRDRGRVHSLINDNLSLGDFREDADPDGTPCVETDTLDIGTYAYIAPELYDDDEKKYVYGKEVDVYSLGIILFEMCYPFNTEMERYEEISKIRVTRKAPLDLWEVVPKQANLIEKLIAYPVDRPTMSETLDIVTRW